MYYIKVLMHLKFNVMLFLLLDSDQSKKAINFTKVFAFIHTDNHI